MGAHWTPHRERLLVTLHELGLPYRAIAQQLGVSTMAIGGKAKRLGLPQRADGRWKKDQCRARPKAG